MVNQSRSKDPEYMEKLLSKGQTVTLAAQVQSGKWPTPVANDDNKSPEAHMAMKARMKGGPRHTITSLQVMVKAEAQGKWPTPRSSPQENRATKPTPTQEAGKHGRYLASEANRHTTDAPWAPGEGGNLNPDWVEALMGLPIGWTAPAGLPDQVKRNTTGSRRGSPKESPTESPDSKPAATA